jgi:CheY-like chemotaxis protein
VALPTGDGRTVLIIDDEPVVRGLIVEVVADLGFAALEATDGPGGLEVLQSRRRIDLLISDVGLPGLNGRQVADAARLLRPGLRVIFMTGYAENAASAHGFLEPGMALISKPFALADLAAKIRATMEDR